MPVTTTLRLKFKGDDIEFRNLQQAQLALALHETGINGTVTVSCRPGAMHPAMNRLQEYFGLIKDGFSEEVTHVTRCRAVLSL